MPVSSPSYFPPNTSTDQITGINAGHLSTSAPRFLAGANAGNNSTTPNLIIIGDNSGVNGITDASLTGTVIVGGQSLPLLKTSSGLANTPGALTILGQGNLAALQKGDSSVIIGAGVLNDFVGSTINAGLQTSVLIGNNAGNNLNGTTSFSRSVIIGFSALAPVAANGAGYDGNVIIGASTCRAITSSCTSNVIIGLSAGQSITGCSGNVIIGVNSTTTAGSGSNTLVGMGITCSNNTATGQNVVVGNSNVIAGTFNTVLGSLAAVSTLATTARNISIGASAGRTIGALLTDTLVIEVNVASDSQKAAIFCTMANGNMILGNSKDAVNRDFGGSPGTNMLKLLNGTAATGTNVIGGGYFYVNAGVLHWVDSSGNDTTLSVPAAPTTGASTATFVATNKPGATTGAGPVAWENRVIDGVSYQSPLWAT